MAVTTRFGSVRGTKNTTFAGQVISSVVMGVGSLSPIENVALNSAGGYNALPRERGSSGIYRTKKPYSSGTFAFDPKAGNWIVAGMGTTISGVANNTLLFMSPGSNNGKSVAEFRHDTGVKMLNLWNANRFSWTGRLADGSAKVSRLMWLNADGTAVEAPATLSTTFMRDMALGSAVATANDNVARPSRTIPGEFTMRADFVSAGLSSGNFFDYKPITGM